MSKKPKQAQRVAREVIFEGQKYISFRVAADILGLSHTTIHQWAKRGLLVNGLQLDVIEDGLTNQSLISKKSIDALLATRFRRSLASLGKRLQPAETPNDASLSKEASKKT
jgi:hypothetical protein